MLAYPGLNVAHFLLLHNETTTLIVRVRSAGFLYPICGDIMTVPGLPTRPGFFDVDINVDTGDVIGLF